MQVVSFLFLGNSGSPDPMRRLNHLQHGKSNVVLVTDQPEILTHSVDFSVGYIDPVQESKEEQQTEDGNDPYINLPYQRRFVDMWVHLLCGESSIAELGEFSVSRGSRGTQSW